MKRKPAKKKARKPGTRQTRALLEDHPALFGEFLGRICDPVDERTPEPRKICATMGMRYGALLEWISEDDVREAQFERALKLRAHLLAEEMLVISDTPQEGVETRTTPDGVTTTKGDMLGHRKLQVETRRFLASRLDRRRYGEQTPGNFNVQINLGDAASEMRALERQLGIGVAVELPRISQDSGAMIVQDGAGLSEPDGSQSES